MSAMLPGLQGLMVGVYSTSAACREQLSWLFCRTPKAAVAWDAKIRLCRWNLQNLVTQWNKYLEFCVYHLLRPLPATVDTVCLYAQYLANNMKSPQTVQNYISGVRVLHLLSDQPLVALVSPDLKLTLKGVARTKLHQPCQAQPITLDMLLAKEELVDKSSPTEVVLWTAILVAFFCLLRKSNYVVDTEKDFDSRKQLCWRDVSVGQDWLLVHIKWSKTIQFGKNSFQIPVHAIPESKLCPVSLYCHMTQIVKAGPFDKGWGCLLPSRKARAATSAVRPSSKLPQEVGPIGRLGSLRLTRLTHFVSLATQGGGGGGGGGAGGEQQLCL